MDYIRVKPNKERVKSILKNIELIKKRIELQDKQIMTGLIISDYYEIIKELLTALLLLDGFKTLSHKLLIDYIKKLKLINNHYISKIDYLRKLRNRISYEGYDIDSSYLLRNETHFIEIINKLKTIISKKIN